MNRYLLLFYSVIFQLLFCLPLSGMAKEVPHEVGGFVLGSDVTEYPNIEYANALKEVVVYDWHGFDKGIISYGVCANPGEIVKIKLKYENSNKDFFKQLLRKYTKKFGKPTEWKGDSFGILHIWKWKFVDEKNNRVHLILQHNLKNPNENIGNVVKLFYPDSIIREQKCFAEQCTQNASNREKEQQLQRKKSGWKYLIPN